MIGRKDKKQFERKEITGEFWKSKRNENIKGLEDWRKADRERYLEVIVGGSVHGLGKERLLSDLSKHLTKETKVDEREIRREKFIARNIRTLLKTGEISKGELADVLNKYVPKNDVAKRKAFVEMLELAQVTEPLKAKETKTLWEAKRDNLLEEFGKSRGIKMTKKFEEEGIIPPRDRIKLRDSLLGIFKQELYKEPALWAPENYKGMLNTVIYAIENRAVTAEDLRALKEKHFPSYKIWDKLVDEAEMILRKRSIIRRKA
jgi:hypothetical protein